MKAGFFRPVSAQRRGDRARDAGRWAEAAAHYREHLETTPQDFAIWVQLGHMLTQISEFGGADESYSRAAALKGDNADLLLCWGHSRKLAGDRDRAKHLYAESLSIDGNASAREELARLIDLDLPPAAEEPAVEEHVSDNFDDAPPVSAVSPTPPRRAWEARYETVKPFAAPEGGEIALFVTHSATGAIKPHVLPYLRALAEQGIAVLLLAVTDRQLNLRPELLDAVAGAIVRENAGYDFAAWAHALHLHPEIYGAATLYLLNDSVAGPAKGSSLAELIARIQASDADLIGLTESHEYRWHFQSYFLALKPRLLSSYRLHRFFEDVRILDDKDHVIQSYELRFSEDVERSGHRLELLFPSPLALNPTLYAWRELIADGFPFMKLLPLRGAFSEVDVEGWQDALRRAGFDVALIDAAARAAEEHTPCDGDAQLYAHPIPFDTGEGRPLKVAFYGPWNYDNGLGAASRALIGALRRCDIRLNLHPIKKPFHIHKPLAPPVDITEFGGPADIAIVHLNPDSWFLLTDEQRRDVGHARKRIGYWVWEMGHIPPAWRHDFSSVDRIWAPSQYCADLFVAQDEAAVDVIPHPVPVAPSAAPDRMAALTQLGLDRDARIILFVFDGSSYLVRKNPSALIRAFAASGLARQGWSLVLKTKHLMDRPQEGAELQELAGATDGVMLIDRSLPADQLQLLRAVADIYASPHCSEGFGLTIAEAMAAGKPVVATDFGGSTDYLDANSGYPVKAREWTLSDDFGHYTRGGSWARIDEPALAAALIKAAADLDAGRHEIGDAARARIAEQLSYARVGALIDASLRRTMTGRGPSPRIEQLALHLDRGTPFQDADFGSSIQAVPLDENGSLAFVPKDLPSDRDHWVAFAPRNAVASPDFTQRLQDQARDRPDIAIFYGDDVAAETDEIVDQLRLKPEFDVTLLAAQDYIAAPLIIRGSALSTLGVRREMGSAVMADLLFRAHAAGMSIGRIPHVLLGHPGRRVRALEADYRAMLAQQPSWRDFDIISGPAPHSFTTLRRFQDPPAVTLVIPTRRTALPDGSGSYIEQLLDALALTDWPMDRLTVIVGDDIADEPSWASRNWPFALQHIATPRGHDEPFNYAAKMNRLWRAAATEQIVFMNDDIRLLEPNWLRALQSFAVDEGVGGVGARLLFEDGSLQHAGMGPHGDGAAHAWIFRNRAEGTYQGWAQTQREWSMVTGAIFATRLSLLEQVQGFEERFSLEFNDTDLCLRLRALGYRIVYTPAAEMVHVEKASRGDRLPPGADVALFLSRWKPWLDNDPSWHPQLRRDRLDVTPQPEPGAWYL
ncbi:rhamnan synthesis F family protein [Sphingomonas sp. ASY06-1R]|uniref:rhamnan synthesis F family protein n=1 Tax=Sphingomonas sp. ASY06-1R TaxID=3445771 RepID=UPI003FA1CE11